MIKQFGACLLSLACVASCGSSQSNSDTTNTADPAMASETIPKGAVFFANDSAELDEEAKAALDNEVRWMAENPSRVVVIHGYASDAGRDTYNLTLGNNRANALREYLVENGVAIERISVVSHGEEGRDLPPSLERRAVFATDRE